MNYILIKMEICINSLTKLETFVTIFQNMKLITDSVNIDCNEERMYIQTMCTSKISILEITIPKAWFCTYSCPTPINVGINCGMFHKILNAREKSQTMQILYDVEGDTDKLFVHMKSPIKTVFDRDFEVLLIDLESEMMEIPEIEYSADISLPSTDFALLINQLKNFGDTLQIQCNEDKIEMVSSSIESGKMSVSLKIDDLTGFAIEEGKQLNMSFSLNLLHIICSYSKISKEVDIKMSENYPLYICYNNEELSIKHFIAPKISED
jgi:proliferating cell nuclear antigen